MSTDTDEWIDIKGSNYVVHVDVAEYIKDLRSRLYHLWENSADRFLAPNQSFNEWLNDIDEAIKDEKRIVGSST